MSKKKEIHKVINTSTGEITIYEIKEGQEVRIVDPKQIEAYKRRQELKGYIEVALGNYFHLTYNYQQPIFAELVAEVGHANANTHIVRLLKLASYLNWNNNLYDNNRNRIKKSSLSKIWGINNRTRINETFELLTKYNYIYMEGDYIMINKDIISKGTIKADKNSTYIRVFIDTLQELYESSDKKKQKQIAHLFKILPYIHYDYNIVCWNPTEQDVTKLELMSWKELASVCGVSANNVRRLKEDLSFKINNQYVIGEFKSNPTDKKPKIVVNPALYYGGSKLEEYRSLVNLFEAGDK